MFVFIIVAEGGLSLIHSFKIPPHRLFALLEWKASAIKKGF
jgi:hypothetical protein